MEESCDEEIDISKLDLLNLLGGLQRQTLISSAVEINSKSSSSNNEQYNKSDYSTSQAFWLQEFGLEGHVVRYLLQSYESNTQSNAQNNHLLWPKLRNTFPSPYHHVLPFVSLNSTNTPLFNRFNKNNYPSVYYDINRPYLLPDDNSKLHVYEPITLLEQKRLSIIDAADNRLDIIKQYKPRLVNGRVCFESDYKLITNQAPSSSSSTIQPDLNPNLTVPSSSYTDPFRAVPTAVLSLLKHQISSYLDNPGCRLSLTSILPTSPLDLAASTLDPTKLRPPDPVTYEASEESTSEHVSNDVELSMEEKRELLVRALGRHTEGLADSIIHWVSDGHIARISTRYHTHML